MPTPRIQRPVPPLLPPNIKMVDPKTGLVTNDWLIYWNKLNLLMQEIVTAINAIP